MSTTKNQTFEALKKKIEQNGDLPVFSATVNHICSVSSDPDADVMSLSQQVLKDANLSIKLLRLANSPYYSRGPAKIGVVSRAIILLGFDTVKNLSLTMKFIESFQNEHPSIDMDKLLVRAYIAAGFVRDMAIKIGIADAEESYTCALLHDLGEIAVATYLPDKYIEISNLIKEGLLPAAEAEKAILGATMHSIGKELAESWDFSPRVVATLESEPGRISGQITKPVELNKVLAVLGGKIVASLYNDNSSNDTSIRELMADLVKATGMKLNVIESSLTESFKMSCELAKTYGLPARKLMPAVADTGDESRDKMARQFSFFASNQIPAETNVSGNSDAAAPNMTTSQHHTDASKSADEYNLRPELQLQFIQEITSLITDAAKLNTVLVKVLEGIHSAAGFPRVVLCLLTMDRKSYSGRIAIGTDKEVLKEFFTRPLNPNNDIFTRVLMEGVEVIAENSHDKRWQQVLPGKFHQQVNTHSFIAAPLKSGAKPLGFVYADKGSSSQPISAEQQRAFIQFIAQARLAFQTCR